ncbi:glycosyltransferase family 4 protein [Polaribacter sp. Q13]|uniref:glycosyltransferase family 4 protein n=1 Tax=Polaribacter sp. Q13 TaxID=2806551 RepID=UPI00193C592E|nr:glycosyltransferase family 4 protein [Polaribacter sp. Q13]QVY64755.1 glycosyltransferase family 4 protein [Polaribacter sp. Q13]
MNNNKNILVISPFFYPEPISTGKFNTSFVTGLIEKGHKVTILCFHPFYPDWKAKNSNEQINGVEIIRGGKNLFYTKKTIFRRLILEFGFAFFVLRKLYKHQKDKDLVIPIFPPSFAFYFALPFLNKQIQKVGMVHDLQEVYSQGKSGFLDKVVRFFIHNIEKKCYQNCNKLIFLSNEMKNEAKKLYQLAEEKLEVQYPFITIKDTITNDLETYFDKKKINIVYSGALGEKQNPIQLFNFFSEASKQIENTVFHFFSEGETLKNLQKINKNKKIIFHNLVHKDNLEELYNRSSVQIIPQKENTSKGSLPSKLPNLLASGCKVLVITDAESEIEELFLNNNLDLVVTSWNNNLLIEKLQFLINKQIDVTHQKTIAKKLFTIDKMIVKVFR